MHNSSSHSGCSRGNPRSRVSTLDDGGVIDVALSHGGIVLGAVTRWRWQGAERCEFSLPSTSNLGGVVQWGLDV
jgi:hypothetical protein